MFSIPDTDIQYTLQTHLIEFGANLGGEHVSAMNSSIHCSNKFGSHIQVLIHLYSGMLSAS